MTSTDVSVSTDRTLRDPDVNGDDSNQASRNIGASQVLARTRLAVAEGPPTGW